MKPKLKYLLSLAGSTLLVTLVPPEAIAQDSDQDTTLIVTALKTPIEQTHRDVSITIIDQARIDSEARPLASALLAQTPDAAVIQYGGPGQPAGLSLRGADTDQTLYVLDGIRLGDPSAVGGGFNAGLLSTIGLSRIEVARGPLSTLWGSRALGGVVSLSSRTAQGPFEADSLIQGGDGFGTAHLGLGGKTARLNWRLSGHHIWDQGVSAFAGGIERDGFDQSGLSLKGQWQAAAHTQFSLYLSADHSRTSYDGYPPPLYAFGDTGEFSKTDQEVGGLGIANFSEDGHLSQQLSLSHTQTRGYYYNDDHSPNFLSRGEMTGLDYQSIWTPTVRMVLIGLIGIERVSMTTLSPSSFDPNPAPFTAVESTPSAALSLRQGLGEALNLTLGGRVEKPGPHPAHSVAQTGLTWRLSPLVRMHAAWGQGFRSPSLYQRFSPYGQADLKPETADQTEAGLDIRSQSGRASLSLTAFNRHGRDQIDFASCYGVLSPICATHPYGYYANIARTQARGLEIEAHLDLGSDTEFSLQTSDIWARNTAHGSVNFGKDLARRPRQSAGASLDHRAGPWTFGLDLNAVGARFDDAGNQVRLAPYALTDLRLERRLNVGLSLFGRLENALDRPYQPVAGYGHVGQRLWIGLKASQ